MFREVLCHDISASDFSFYADQPPATEFLVAAFGTGAPLTYLKAQVIHCTRPPGGSQFLIGCRYTGRALRGCAAIRRIRLSAGSVRSRLHGGLATPAPSTR